MPLSQSEFPIEVQVAFFVFDLLSDVWEGMSGTYMGKDWSHCSHLFDIREVEDQMEGLKEGSQEFRHLEHLHRELVNSLPPFD